MSLSAPTYKPSVLKNVLLSAPSTEPLSLADAKTWLRIEHTADDALITDLITASRETLERELALHISVQSIQAEFVGEALSHPLPYGPHGALSSVKKIDLDGTETALTEDVDFYMKGLEYKQIRLVSALSTNKSLELTVISGYTTTPGWAITALKRMVADNYEHRESTAAGLVKIPSDVLQTVSRFNRRMWF